MAVTELADLDLDPEVPGLFNRPDYYDILRRLRRESPVHRYAPGSWLVTRYADVRAISRDPERFCSGRGVLMGDPLRSGGELPGSILHMDPPVHGHWRRIGSRWFTPRAVGVLEERIRGLAARILDEVPVDETVDFVESCAVTLPVVVIAELLGLGGADQADFRRWSDACIEGADGQDDALERMAAVGELMDFLHGHTEDRRSAPRDDLLTELAQAEIDGEPLRAGEVVMYCLSLLVAGNETTRHLLSGSMVALHDNPDQRALLAATPDLLPGAVEECLRWVTPIQCFARTTTVDVEVGDVAIPAGDWVVMMYASANRDEEVFGAASETFDVARPTATTQLAFGFGEHLCLGAALARLETRVFLEELLARHPHYELPGGETWTASTLVRGLTTLPIVFRGGGTGRLAPAS